MEKTESKLSQWVEDYTEDLFSWALHKVSDPELARDIVQDTFLAAVERIEGFREDSTPKTWLFSILNYKIIDHYRKKVKQPIKLDKHVLSTFFDDEGNWIPEKRPHHWDVDTNLLDNPEFQSVLNMCLDALPDKWRTCVRLKYLMSKNGEEICQDLNINPTNMWQIIHRSKLKLRECIEQKWFKV